MLKTTMINNKKNKSIYWIATGLLTAFMLMSVVMYLFDSDSSSQNFATLGYPGYLIYILATAKTLGLIAILSNKSRILKEWAYAGFTFNFILAIIAHLASADGAFAPAVMALVLVIISYLYDKKIISK